MVSERAVRDLLAIVSLDRDDIPELGLPPSLLSDLCAQVGCDFLTFSGQDTGRQEFLFVQAYLEGDSDAADGDSDDRVFWDNYRACDHCSYPDSGDLRSVTKTSDFYSARQWHNTGMYSEVLPDVEHMLMLCLPAGALGYARSGPGHDVRLVLCRGPGADFPERDRALLELLRPHLYLACLDLQERRRGVPGLTSRQWELLRMVAAGYTNDQIARRLTLSSGTVRTHMQNIYSRLEVSNRMAAVGRAFPDRPF